MDGNPSQKHWWELLSAEDKAQLDIDALNLCDHDSSEDDGFDAMGELYANVKLDVNEWMTTYGRSHIREWLNDNAKNLLKSDGVLNSGGKRKAAEHIQKPGAFKTPRKAKQSDVMEIGE